MPPISTVEVQCKYFSTYWTEVILFIQFPFILITTLSMMMQVRPSCVRPLPKTSGIPSVIKAITSLFQSFSSTFLASLRFPRSLFVQYRGTNLFDKFMDYDSVPATELWFVGCTCTADWLAQLVEYWTTVRKVVGSNPSRTTTQGHKMTEEKVLPL